MPEAGGVDKDGGYLRDTDLSSDRASMTTLLHEYDVFRAQREKRIELLKELEEARSKRDGKRVAYIGFLCLEKAGAAIDSDDIPAFGNALASVGDVDELDLIINSPGGDGTVAEKIIELCRAYCDKFRVVVPNRAKSAATIIALGSDEIVMGYCSELGPIDAQVLVVSSGIPQFISAQSFIDARDTLEERYREATKAGESGHELLQQLAGLDPAYVNHCEQLMAFSRDVATKYLKAYMLRNVKPAKERDRRIEKIIESLSSTDLTRVHGRMIDGNAAKTDLRMKVEILPKDDELWHLIWEYYLRADLAMATPPATGKLVESRNEVLMKSSLRT